MTVRELKLRNFRNLAAVTLRVPAATRVVALVGRNGAGKTSVLEGLSLLGGGRGLLGAEARAQLRAGQREYFVGAETAAGSRVSVALVGGQKKPLADGRAAGAAELAALLPVLWLAPRLDRLFYEGPGERRGWLDDAAAVQRPAHAEVVARYQKHKRGRLLLLKTGKTGGDWLEAEERLMAEAGLALLQGRLALLAALNGVAEGFFLSLKGSALEILAHDDPVVALREKFARSREIDARLERTHAGPDTLDLGGFFVTETGDNVLLNQVSSGQHKRALVRLILAQARLLTKKEEKRPVVIIDELGAHLDLSARAAVLADLTGLGCQVWVSDTELSVPEGLGVMVVRMAEGEVTAELDSGGE